MTYLRVKKDKKLTNEKYNKFKRISEGQLLTLKEFYRLVKAYFNLTMADVEIVERTKKQVSTYYWDIFHERYSEDELPIPF